MHLWDTYIGTRAGGLGTSHWKDILALAWSPGGDHLAIAEDVTTQVPDVAAGRVLRALEYGAHVCTMTWSSDGKHLLTITDENCLASLWNAGAGELLRTFGYQEPVEDWYPFP